MLRRVRGSGFGVQGGRGPQNSLPPASPGTRNPEPGTRSKGSVLILAMILVAALALVATAFIVTARLEARGSTNALRGLQAEAACRAGLAAAVYRIGATWEGCYSIDSATGWHGFFHDASGPDLCPDGWVAHYDPPAAKREMKAGTWPMPRVEPTDPAAPDIVRLKRLRGFTAEYCVAVADLDGKLHANPKYFDNLLDDVAPSHDTRDMLDELTMSSSQTRDAVLDDAAPNWSIGQLRAKLIAAGVTDDGGTLENELNEAEKFFTVYPRVPALSKANMGRPPVNVNTAREEVLRAIIVKVPGCDVHAGTIATKLITQRLASGGFKNRKELEAAIDDLAPAPVGDDTLTEQQFNDLLNSLNFREPSLYANNGDKAGGTEGDSGVYEYNFDGATGPEQTGGDKTSNQPSATWGTEVKFTSRFFHIYALGRTVAADAEQTVLAERRLHAVYDAGTKKILWSRWHYYPKANMKD